MILFAFFCFGPFFGYFCGFFAVINISAAWCRPVLPVNPHNTTRRYKMDFAPVAAQLTKAEYTLLPVYPQTSLLGHTTTVCGRRLIGNMFVLSVGVSMYWQSRDKETPYYAVLHTMVSESNPLPNELVKFWKTPTLELALMEAGMWEEEAGD